MRANIEENNTCTEAITVLRRRLQAQMQPQATLLCKFTHTVLYIHVIVYYTHARMHACTAHARTAHAHTPTCNDRHMGAVGAYQVSPHMVSSMLTALFLFIPFPVFLQCFCLPPVLTYSLSGTNAAAVTGSLYSIMIRLGIQMDPSSSSSS